MPRCPHIWTHRPKFWCSYNQSAVPLHKFLPLRNSISRHPIYLFDVELLQGSTTTSPSSSFTPLGKKERLVFEYSESKWSVNFPPLPSHFICLRQQPLTRHRLPSNTAAERVHRAVNQAAWTQAGSRGAHAQAGRARGPQAERAGAELPRPAGQAEREAPAPREDPAPEDDQGPRGAQRQGRRRREGAH